MKTKVHRNLHKACWSIRQGKAPTAHKEYAFLRNVEFRVSQAGRAKVLANKVRSVHAYASGELCEHAVAGEGWQRIRYNPYVAGAFLADDGREIWSAKLARFDRLGRCEVIL